MAAEYEHTFYFCDPSKRSWQSPSSSPPSSYQACHSDEGYDSDEKRSSSHAQEIPILKSTRSITRHLITHPPPWMHSFPPVFIAFTILFHTTHLFAHLLDLLTLERLCVVYGTWLYSTGWLLGTLVFTERLPSDFYYPTLLFWILMLERRNAWGIIVWEFVGRLDHPHEPASANRWRLFVFRTWCLLGTGSFWGLLYTALAHSDGFALSYLLAYTSILKLLLVSTFGGLMMICYWSFWTFQYRGVLWRKELRKGIVVWISEGVTRAGDVE
ncbi:hypothetical protein PHYBLDRAFT_138280 [Phycomyces blakesleeanus NRRL 1555(-)]|uniref:Uncharacterized protein n=1 Tax=Phycomyces blakesleeanus (strain ATCC 8743b / DSM 1359 / FGSC 10004 / NBRC 33097 / NRRL 1555) TaxID=763407 RepID=A0A167R323_PHYB8|nr:hypothetical protein PHYBLDRAFT_138280 [Phycomyces blakesleeanus NRRL 1555(-)]OAD80734.1 hypothetical protein PHYBLDRAFT_138280 [Phycomyces blakesleeanus NRRL 1555(-)]|eukprot:XP_018298774.1 hypothetical protein PHYBLDRAFT_138280 [Phycomyces blakesleeanus NRRL 1555(-)]